MQGMKLSDIERWSERVLVVRGLNPGVFPGPGTNTYLLGTGERPLLLDTGSGEADYIPLLAGALREHFKSDVLGDILLTHVHPDHIGGAASIIKHFGPRRVFKMPWPVRDDDFDVELTATYDGEVFECEGVTLRAIHTPGHARDHLCFYLEEERALFTGDVILGAGTTVIPTPESGGDLAQYMETLSSLLELDIERIYPGHGPLIAEPIEKIREYIAHRNERERQIIEAMNAGAQTVEKIVERVYVDTPRYLHTAAGASVLSHLIKLEHEDRAQRQIDAAGQEHWTCGR